MVSFILPGNSASGGYEVANSCRFERSSSDYLSKTFGSGGNRKTATQSFWFKRSLLSTNMMVGLTNYPGGSYYGIQILTDDVLDIYLYYSGSAWEGRLKTNRKFRDVSAWYHFVLAWDTTQSTASDRFKLYVNGVQETDFQIATYPDQNQDVDFNNNIAHQINSGGGGTFSGYLAEFCFIDGQALTPTSFGEFDEDTNIWKPIDVSGLTFGNNGFYLDFEDSSALGDDVSGNGNDFTVNNLTSIDQTTDTCTNNFATFNPLVGSNAGGSTEYYGTFTEGNTHVTGNAAQNSLAVSTIGASQGKWYAEFILISETDSGAGSGMGVTDDLSAFQTENVQTSSQIIFDDEGQIVNRGTSDSGSNSFSTGDVIGVALDLDNNFVYFSINGTFINSGNPASGSSGTGGTSLGSGTDEYFFFVGDSRSGGVPTFRANFGNPSATISSGNSDGNGYGNFEYSVPSGYYALNTKNLAEYG
jgi:hypothetical protein